MHSIDWLLGIGVTLSVVSMYLRFRATGRAFEFVSAGFAGIGLCLLAVSAAGSPDWWPESEMDSAVRQFVFWAMSLLCVVGAGFAITADDSILISGGCGSLGLGTAGLLLLNDLAGLASGVMVVAAIAGWRFLARRWTVPHAMHEPGAKVATPTGKAALMHEPLLACVVGGVIGAILLGSVREATFEEAYSSQIVQNGKSLISKRRPALPLTTSQLTDANPGAFWTLIPLGGVLCGFAAIAGSWLKRT
ncbi:MAG: hypothetical protein O3A00_01645 [Planctomycetota bacterium]|nr:hypothetical protein [Planctomycetota bacterium]